jgi:hypothetical protein
MLDHEVVKWAGYIKFEISVNIEPFAEDFKCKFCRAEGSEFPELRSRGIIPSK